MPACLRWLRFWYSNDDVCHPIAAAIHLVYRSFDVLATVGGRIKQKGFSLIELALVLLIVGILSVGGVGLLSGLTKRKQYSDTRTSLELVNVALVNFVSRAGRLPCPADGSTSAGTEVRTAAGACTAQLTGVVPWLTLGVSEADILDGWSSRITYRVAPELALDDAMNLSACDPAGTAAASGGQPSQSCRSNCNKANNCTPDSAVLIGKGLTVRNAAGVVQANPVASTGAGFVLISHGENRHGGYSNNILQAGSPSAGASELVNANNQPLAASYVSDEFNANTAPVYFDDLVFYRSVQWVVVQARLDGRRQF